MGRLDRRRFFVNGGGGVLLPGESRLFDLPGVYPVTLNSGTYKIRMYGAQGGNIDILHTGCLGGYSEGVLTISKQQTVYVVVGGQGNYNSPTGGYNGGGGLSESSPFISTGGGATDLCLTKPTIMFNDTTKQYERDSKSLLSRVIVAAGGAGRAYKHNFFNESEDKYGTYQMRVPIDSSHWLKGVWQKCDLVVTECDPVEDPSTKTTKYNISAVAEKTITGREVGVYGYDDSYTKDHLNPQLTEGNLRNSPWLIDELFGGVQGYLLRDDLGIKKSCSLNYFNSLSDWDKVNDICKKRSESSVGGNSQDDSYSTCYIVDTVAKYSKACINYAGASSNRHFTLIDGEWKNRYYNAKLVFQAYVWYTYQDKPLSIGDVVRQVYWPAGLVVEGSLAYDRAAYEFFADEVPADFKTEYAEKKIALPISINENYCDSGIGFYGGGLTGGGDLAGSFDDSKGNLFGQNEVADISNGKLAVPGGGGWYCGKNHVFAPGEEIKGGGGSGFVYSGNEELPSGFVPTNEYQMTNVVVALKSTEKKPWFFGHENSEYRASFDFAYYYAIGDGLALITRIS